MLAGSIVYLMVFHLSVKEIFANLLSGNASPSVIETNVKNDVGDGFRGVDYWNVIDHLSSCEAHETHYSCVRFEARKVQFLAIRVTDEQDCRYMAAR